MWWLSLIHICFETTELPTLLGKGYYRTQTLQESYFTTTTQDSNPVSYTHLDVYKRQQGMSGNGLTTEKGNENSWIDISVMAVPANFFSFMNIPIEQGRLPQHIVFAFC